MLKTIGYLELISLLNKNQKLPAIWRNKDHDAPVTVVGYYGTTQDNTIHYAKIEGSATGIPLNELLFFY